MPDVSVIIPNYNHAAFLKQRIDSVLAQTYQDFEVIILDDCSTDNSKTVIEHYRGHAKVKHIVYNYQNSGSTFKQWLKGISLANGNYVWIAESDDWCEPTFLENIVPYMQAKPECVVGYCQSYCVVENEIKAQSSHPYLTEFVDGTSFIKAHMVSGNAIYNASMAIWKKEAFQKIGQDFTQYRFCGDWLFWVELCSMGTVFITGRVLNYFRKHDKDVSGSVYSSGYNFYEELKLLKAMQNKHLIDHSIYKNELARKYFFYRKKKGSLEPQLEKSIDKLFVADASTGFLFSNYLLLSIKYGGYRLLKTATKILR